MPKLVLNNIASGFATNTIINSNFDTIEAALENTLSRDGSTPNHMLSSLDMNSHSIHNLGRATTLSSAMSLGQFLEYANTEESLTGVVPITWEFTSTGASSYQITLASTNKVDMYIVAVDGLIYSPTEYTIDVDTQTIFFNTVPAVGTNIVIRLFGKIPEATSSSVNIQNIRQSFIFTIVSNETTFSTTVELIENTDVFLNGVKLIYSVDYNVSGMDVVLTSPGNVGDTLEVITYSAIVVASEVLQEVIAATAEVEALLLTVDESVSDSLALLTADATTLSVGSPATAAFVPATKTLTIGVPVGATGATGSTGPGVVSGGTTGQLLSKVSSTDYLTEWTNNITLPKNFTYGSIKRVDIDIDGVFTITSPSTFGYGTGAGGSVTQATDKSTGVTLNKPCGTITTHDESMAPGVVKSFLLENTKINANSVLVLSGTFASGANRYSLEVSDVGAGFATIRITNITAGTYTDNIVINFVVLSAVTA
jgi:hypothetical protein